MGVAGGCAPRPPPALKGPCPRSPDGLEMPAGIQMPV
ncbi:hypothetical protein STRTUCAR8_06144, partial [Streptomyces turgidiscabies Car8]